MKEMRANEPTTRLGFIAQKTWSAPYCSYFFMWQLGLLVLGFSVSSTCCAFDVEGFKTGMPKTVVVATAEKTYKLVTIDENTLVANAAGGSYLSFNFCGDKLVSVQQGYQANLRQVTLLVAEFKAKYGNPFSTAADTRAHATGTIYEWGMWWNAGTEFVSVYFSGSEQGDSLSTSHQSKNKCFKVPR